MRYTPAPRKQIEAFTRTEKLLADIEAAIKESGSADQQLWVDAMKAMMSDTISLAAELDKNAMEQIKAYTDASIKGFADGLNQAARRNARF